MNGNFKTSANNPPLKDLRVSEMMWQMVCYQLNNKAALAWFEQVRFSELGNKTPLQILQHDDPDVVRSGIEYLVKDIHNHYLGITTDRLFTADEVFEQWTRLTNSQPEREAPANIELEPHQN